MYIADTGNDLIRSLDFSTPFVSFLTGSTSALTLANATGASLSFAQPEIQGMNQSDFAISSNTCSVLSPSASCQLQITFNGSSLGTQQASVHLSTLDGTMDVAVTMEALANTGGQLAVSPTLLTFTTKAGEASVSSAIGITNTTATPITLETPQLVGAGAGQFQINTSTCPPELQAAASCTLSILFVPTTAGSFQAGVSIPGGPTSVDLSGLATATSGGSGSTTTPITPTPPANPAPPANPTPIPMPTPTPAPTPTPPASNPGSSLGLQFVPVQPCRVADTRSSAGTFGGPILSSGTTRTFPIPQSACNIPANAAAYSLNVTAVPTKGLGYLSIWPAGQAKPYVSTLNSDGRIKANAVIVGAGTSGGVSVYVSDSSHVALDIDGYFVAAGTVASALDFYPVAPCRLVDTRSANGSLGGPSLSDGETRSFPLVSGACNLPGNVRAYSLNFTVVPHGSFGYLSVWPAGQGQPYVSTLNAFTGTVTSNAAIVPAGQGGDISVYVTDEADLVIDVNGYFASPAAGGLSLYTMTPCRALDTRNNGAAPFTGKLVVPVENSSCALPSTAAAYVANATLVPPGPVGFLALWPDGYAQPLVSTLNSFDGATTSNMAILPVENGSVDAYVSHPGHLILDIAGYFAP
jgi:hypothetical protein